ncbi:MAG: sensor domain-containing diguanylate cyclase [Pseudomonadota bacterium]
MDFHTLPPERLIHFIVRTRKFDVERYEDYLHSLLLNVLSDLNEFVPSEGILMLVDDPIRKREGKGERELTYVAVSGKNSASLLGKRMAATSGVAGEIYTLGKSMVRKADRTERLVIDKANLPQEAIGLVGVPLRVETTIVGALIAYNKKDPIGYTMRDLKLVEIFAGYLSTALQNAIDARKSKELTKRDDLTGLYNDRFFHVQLETEVRKADEQRHPLTLLFLDLDHFKNVNDAHGHLVGSQTLREIGFVLTEAIDLEGAFLARYGGDEYVVILPGIDLIRAVEIAERTRMMIAGKLFMIDQGEHDGSFINFKGLISASFGVASLHDHVPTGGTVKDRKNFLVRLADAAMYRAKEAGKNCVCVADPTLIRPKP